MHVFASGSSRGGGRCGCNRCSGLNRRRGGGTFGFEDHDLGTGGNLVTHLDQDLFDDTGGRGRYFHGGLVAFYRDDGLIEFDLVTHGHHDLGDFNFIGADIRHHNLFGHCALSSCVHPRDRLLSRVSRVNLCKVVPGSESRHDT